MPKKVAIVVPVYKKEMSADEQVSFHHLRTHLVSHDTFLLSPESLGVTFDVLPVKTFPDKWFKGTHTYSELLLSPQFYQAFADYEYILIYQLDCLVFRDELLTWCARGYDYIGAPWVTQKDGRYVYEGVGNGGFSLRKISSALDVLKIYRATNLTASRRMQEVWNLVSGGIKTGVRGLKGVLKSGNAKNLLQRGMHEAKKVSRNARPEYKNEDVFWAFEAPVLWPDFNIPPASVALRFAFEREPRFCYAEMRGELPFGCHNWAGMDRKFWEEFVQRPSKPYQAENAISL
jgi:hypothetical protein